jgi:hypothetical protein
MERKTRAVAAAVFFCLIWVNVLFYSQWGLPMGQVDIDNYLISLGDTDPRLPVKASVAEQPAYYVFYHIVKLFGNPRITFLWLPPLMLAVIVVYVQKLYQRHSHPLIAHIKMLVFVFGTFNVWFFFICGLYRQTMGMMFLLIGLELLWSGRWFGLGLILLGLAVHIHLAPIGFITWIAYLLSRRQYRWAALSFCGGVLAASYLNLWGAVGWVNRPSLYTVFYIATNPLLWGWGLKELKWTYRDILFLLLLVTMPFSEAARGMIFLHLILVDRAVDKFMDEHESNWYIAAIVFLSILWFNYMGGYLIKSLIIDSADRGLDLSKLVDIVHLQDATTFR